MGRSMLSEVNTWWIFLRCSASGNLKQLDLFSRFSRDQRLRRSAAEMSSLCWRLASSPLSMSQLVEEGGGGKLIKWSLDTFITSVLAPQRGWGALRVVWEAPTLVVTVRSTIRKQSIVTATAQARRKPNKISFVLLLKGFLGEASTKENCFFFFRKTPKSWDPPAPFQQFGGPSFFW